MILQIDAVDRDMIERGDRISADLARSLLRFYDDHSTLLSGDAGELVGRLHQSIEKMEVAIARRLYLVDDARSLCLRSDEAATLITSLVASNAEMREAIDDVLGSMSSTYKARNGRTMSIEADDGEKCWIVHSDQIEALRRAREAQGDEHG